MKALLVLLAVSGCGEVYLNPPDLGASASPIDGSMRSEEQPSQDASADSKVMTADLFSVSDGANRQDAGATIEHPSKPADCQTGALWLGSPDDSPCRNWCSVVNQVLQCP